MPAADATQAQRGAVRRYLLSHHGEQIAEFVEESGKRRDRPQLAVAMALAKKRKATIPGANRRTLYVLAAAAEHERHMIGERTHHALAAAKARGVKLGNPEQAKINRANAAERARALHPHIERCIKAAAYRAVQSQPILTRAASRHRMAANGFRCKFVAFGIVSAYDDWGLKSRAWILSWHRAGRVGT